MRTTVFYLIWIKGRKSRKSAGVSTLIGKYPDPDKHFMQQFAEYCKHEDYINAGT